MGCTSSKLDDLPAVALCRDRCNFLDDAVRMRYALADAHVAYMQSLSTVGVSLHRFFGHVEKQSGSKKEDAVVGATAGASDSSHLQFRPDSIEDDGGGSESLKNNCVLEHEALGSMNYEKNQPAQSVAYFSFPDYVPNSYQFFDSSSTAYKSEKVTGSLRAPAPSPLPASGGDNGSDSNPPPSPPRNSAWDFLNLFDESYKFPPYSPMRTSEDRRDEEVAKEERKSGDDAGNYSKVPEEEGEGISIIDTSASGEEDDAAEKRENGDSDEDEGVQERSDSAKIRSLSETMREIQSLFEKASESGSGVTKMLEAGKLNYHPKNSVYQVSSKMLNVITPSLLVVSSNPSAYLELNEDMGMSSGNLSSTLKKLHMWEKKLYDEVKGEEKLRIMREKKCKQLKLFEEKGADAHKAEAAHTLIRSISTKIRIAIDVVDKISIAISKLRDEELWLQIDELIHGLSGMWKGISECVKRQSEAVSEAKSSDTIVFNGKVRDEYLEALLELKLEVQNWNLRFSNWINAQKGFVKGLNGWLSRCLMRESEPEPEPKPEPEPEPEDEEEERSRCMGPAAMGAPPVFVICSQWAEAMERFSAGDEVVEAMESFLARVNQVLEQHGEDLQERMIADKDMERRVKKKKTVAIGVDDSGECEQGESDHGAINVGCLQSGLQQIFVAMERFTAALMHAYDELRLRTEDAKLLEKDGRLL